MNKYLITIVILAVAGVGAYVVFGGMSVETPGTGDQGEIAEPQPQEQEEKNVADFVLNHAQTQTVALEAVDDSTSSGTCYRLFVNGTLSHVVRATMPDPAAGNSYEGWLVQPAPLEFFSTGVMERDTDGTWFLVYTADSEYPTYTRVVITEETIVDAVPEEHILEGEF